MRNRIGRTLKSFWKSNGWAALSK